MPRTCAATPSPDDQEVSMYSGDEWYDDDITSGPLPAPDSEELEDE